MISSNCATVRADAIGALTVGWARSHASAMADKAALLWFTETPLEDILVEKASILI